MINNLKRELIQLSEPKYKEFSSKLTPNIDNILGVRLPILRRIAKRLIKENYIDFFKQNDDEFFELTMLEGMIIGYLPVQEQVKHIKKFIPKINNWAVCDSFCTGLKNISIDFIEPYFKSSKEYELRFAFVILLNCFIDSNYDYVIRKISEFNNEQYYAKMAVAWCLSICIVKNYKHAIKDIRRLKIQPWVFKKGITKAIESLRLTNNQKQELRNIRNYK